MLPKKSEKANLENKRGLFLQTGFILVMGIVLVAFEWYSPYESVAIMSATQTISQDLDPTVITRQNVKTIPPPPKIQYDQIKIVKNDLPDDFFDPEQFDFSDFNSDKPIYMAEIEDETLHIIVEKMPLYKGGDENTFRKEIYSKLKYPELAQKIGIEGIVHVSFVIDKTGKMRDIQIVRSDETVFNDTVIKALSESDRWTPGYQRDKAVNVRFSMAFKFELMD